MNGPEANPVEILRAPIFHTPGNPFESETAFVAIADGALAIQSGRILACDDYTVVAHAWPRAPVRDLRGGYLLPGFVDTHVHFPQTRIIGGLGYSLLDWLEQLALPEEARLADSVYAAAIAREFIHQLGAHGTTTALVFGAHFAGAMAALFEAAAASGLRLTSGLVLADRGLLAELHQTPEDAWRDSRELIGKFHGKGRLSYAVTPRFALSASEAMLEVCGNLLRSDDSLHFTTHINENTAEIAEVARLFPGAPDYLEVYERFDLIGRRSVLAHNVHAKDEELTRLHAREASIAHCPCSNAALGSGIFPMRRHLDARVRFGLGTDVGGGTGFGILKETLQAYLMQRVGVGPIILNAAQMLYLATRAGAECLALENETGDFTAGKSADFVYLVPERDGELAGVLRNADEPLHALTAILTLGGGASIREVRVGNDPIFQAAS